MGNRGIFYRQLVTPIVVVSAVSTVTMICITVFQNSWFFIRLSIVLMKKNFKNPFIDINLCQDYRCCCRCLIENKFSSSITINNSMQACLMSTKEKPRLR